MSGLIMMLIMGFIRAGLLRELILIICGCDFGG